MKPFKLYMFQYGNNYRWEWELQNQEITIVCEKEYKTKQSCRRAAKKVVKELNIKVYEEIE